MTVPAIPQARDVQLAQLPRALEVYAARREWCREHADMSRALEVKRQLDALQKYVADRRARPLVEAEQRLTEVLIGELLGPPMTRQETGATGGRGNERSSSDDDLSELHNEERRDFRLMAEHAELVTTLVTEKKATTRAAIIREIQKEERRAAAAARSGAGYTLLEGDLLEVGTQIADDSVDVILTDPPYDLAAVSEYADLAALAKRVLRPGGSLFAMVGQWHLARALQELSSEEPELTYHWTLCYLTPGQAALAATVSRRVNAGWKPVVWFVKGEYEGRVVGDVARSDRNDKDHHHWGQSEGGIADLMGRCSEEGDLVLDPYVGGGTIGYVAVAMGRRFVGIDRDPEALAVAAARMAG